MNDYDYRDLAYACFGELIKLAPNGTEQEKLAQVFNQMQSDGNTWKYIADNMSYALSDGIRYGNWPWEK